MKKLLFSMMALLAIVACGSDDPDEPVKGGIDNQVVGTWTFAESDAEEDISQTLTLKADGTFTLDGVVVLKDAEEIAEEGYTKQEAKIEGTYTTINKTLTLIPTKASVRNDGKKWEDVTNYIESNIWKYSVSGNKLTVTDSDDDETIFTKK